MQNIKMKRVTLAVNLDIGTLSVEAKSTAHRNLFRGEFTFNEAESVLKTLAKKLAPGVAAGTPVEIKADTSNFSIPAAQ